MSTCFYIMQRLREDICYLRHITLLLTVMHLSGCAVGPDFDSPEAPQAKSYTEDALPAKTVDAGEGDSGQAQTFLLNQDISKQWWALFKCKALDTLIKQGLSNSPNLQASQAALRKAQENWNAETGALVPAIDAQGSFTREKNAGAQQGLPNARPFTYNVYNVSANVSYTLDVFGGIRRQIEALEAQVDFQNFELAAAWLTLTSNIVTTAINEASLRGQIEATKEIIALQEKTRDIIKAQFDLGGASQADVLAQETLLAQTRATLPPLEKALATSRHALYVLVGEFPGDGKLPTFHLKDIKLPTKLPVTLPSTLVRQRPDVKAAEALLHQASAQVGVARANFFPQLTLAGSAGSIADRSHNLFGTSSNVWSLGTQLLQPLFRGGALVAQERAAVANYEQAFAAYRQTVLKAFQNVADTLRALVEDARTLKGQREAEKTAQQSLELTRKQYQLGAISFPTLLNAEHSYHQARINRIQAEATRYSNTAALFQALGGGWWKHDLKSGVKQAGSQKKEYPTMKGRL